MLNNKIKNDKKNINIDNNFKEDNNLFNLPEIRRYTFVEKLGEGAFGKVHLYKEKINPKNLIAVKVFNGINEDNIPKNIKKEKNLLLSINHPNIVKYLFSCFDNNNFYIGMEYCKNKDLAALINDKKKKKN